MTPVRRSVGEVFQKAHLQDDAEDTLQVPHTYTGAPLKLFVTNLTRRMTIPGNSGSGEYTDSVEGWVL